MLFAAGFGPFASKRKSGLCGGSEKQALENDSGFYSVTPATPELLQLLSPIPTVQSL